MSLSQPVKAKEQISDQNKRSRQDTDPHQNTGDTLGIQIHEEIRIDQRSVGAGDCETSQARRI